MSTDKHFQSPSGQHCTEVTLHTCIWKVFGSNPGRHIGYPDRNFDDFPQSLQVNAGTVLLLPVTVAARSKANLRSLEHWTHGFDSHSRHGCLVCVFCVCVVLCLGRGLATSWSLVLGVLSTAKNDYGTESEARALNGLEEKLKKKIVLLLDHNRFLPNHFQFIVHVLSYHWHTHTHI
jgi:hypothetical protein